MDKLRRSESWALVVLASFTLASLIGFATFGRHPELLAAFPKLAGLYAPAFTFFARGHIVLALGALAVILWNRAGLKWLPAFGLVCVLSLGAELLGTATGFPFGSYHYTELLGWRIADRVPALIPASWFVMALPSYGLARAVVANSWGRWLYGAALLATWDLSLDPAMSSLTPYWGWDVAGSFYGMPAVNLLGWLATGVLLMVGLDLTGAHRVTDEVPRRLLGAYYGVVLSLSVGMVIVGGYWWAVLATAGALAVLALVPNLVLAVTRPVSDLAAEGG
ncbi:MAG: carotenoid biosynthesis protein [Longimicrobiales bacterium]